MYILGVIPARGGSKSIARKNLRPLANKPLIAWTIEAARRTTALSRVIVSSEDGEILDIVRRCGADVPFVRPAPLAADGVPSLPVVQHAVLQIEADIGRAVDAVCLLQPTSPLRTSEDIERGVRKLIDTRCDSVVSVVNVGANHPLRMKRIVGEDILVNYVEQSGENMRPRQELPPVYIRDGSIYLALRRLVMEHQTLVGGNVRALLMPADRTVNIDEPWDFARAEWMVAHRM
jgi:CMP-N-acetylneuraminic acid synthetase